MQTVLVVDDDEISRRAICTALARRYRVLEAQSGAEAERLSELHKHALHLLVADVLMPVAYGTEVARTIGRLCPELPVLFVSGSPMELLVREHILVPEEFEGRAVLFLQKPFRVQALYTKVEETLQLAQYRSLRGAAQKQMQ